MGESRSLSSHWSQIFCWYELCIRNEKCTPRQTIFSWVWPLVMLSPYCCGLCTTFPSQSSFASFLRLRKSASWFPPVPYRAGGGRYHAILKPFETGLRLNKDNIKRAIACIWIASLIICFPEFFLKEWSETYAGCIGPWTLQMNEASQIYVAINLTIAYMQIVVTFSPLICSFKFGAVMLCRSKKKVIVTK